MKTLLQIYLIFFALSKGYSAEVISYYPTEEHLIIPQGMHLLAAKGIDGSLIELQNGAQFEIIEADQRELLNWQTHAPLTISPNPYWFSSGDFFISNLHRKTYVRANYINGPVFEHYLTNQILDIDPYYGEIILIDGRRNQTYWKLDHQDINHIQNWKIGETVIIGKYDTWYSNLISEAKYILISYENFDFTKFVRASLISH